MCPDSSPCKNRSSSSSPDPIGSRTTAAWLREAGNGVETADDEARRIRSRSSKAVRSGGRRRRRSMAMAARPPGKKRRGREEVRWREEKQSRGDTDSFCWSGGGSGWPIQVCVWTAEDFRKIIEVLVDAKLGSRIIITTRSEEVASIAPDGCRIKVGPLEEDDAWRLFCRKAFPNTENHICPLALQECGKLIVGRCDGLPLALLAIGSLLSLKAQNITEWKLFDAQLSSELHNNENLSRVEKILNLSYKYLPDYLKSCFLYCAMFPEDHMIHRKRLIRLWVAEGFVEQIGNCSLEDVDEGYLTQLVQRSMLHVVKRNSFNRIKCLRGSKVFIAKLANLSQLRSVDITVRSIHCAELCDSELHVKHVNFLLILWGR